MLEQSEQRAISAFLSTWLKDSRLQNETEAETFKKYYRGYIRSFSKRMQYFYSCQIEDLMALLAKAPEGEKNVLEVGCGTGTESLWLALHGASVTAADIKDDRLEVARSRKAILEQELGRSLHCSFNKTSVLDIEAPEAFDFIWMEQTFHHLEPREKIVKKLASLLKPHGHLVISEANALNPLLQLQLLNRRGFKTIVEFEDQKTGEKIVYGNERILTASRLEKLFEGAGIQKVYTRHFRIFPNSKAFAPFFKIEKKFPQQLRPFFTHFNYVGQKR